MKLLKEWFISAPWGQIAMISWGNPDGVPILLVHGRQDSVATFIPLLELLPDKYYYVGFDLPGHGKSDHFPTGVMLARLHFVAAVEVVVKHLGWTRFVYLAHSLGSELGLFYNALGSKRIKKFIHLDVTPGMHSIQNRPLPDFYKYFYETYYSNYKKYNYDERVYTKRKALEAVMNARGFSESQAEVILSRNLTCIGEDKYRVTWDRRTKYLAHLNLLNDHYLKIFTTDSPPTLLIMARQTRIPFPEKKETVEQLIQDMADSTKDFYIKTVDGTHDVHFTNPERFSDDVIEFLDKDFGVKSKL